MVAVVERGGFLWFCNFFVGFVAFVYFFLIFEFFDFFFCPGSLLHGGPLLVHRWWYLGFLLVFVAYGQTRWLYGEVFAFLNMFGLLSFCLGAFLF